MRAKTGKRYRKLMKNFEMHFGFREPYQVLVDAEIVVDSARFVMDLAPALERTLHGKVKPMITQCEMRKLYSRGAEPGMAKTIEHAKTFERRRCGHHPNEYPEPLSAIECLTSVVDEKGRGTNKHRYVVASQSQDLRKRLRAVQGVPLIYISRSVMIMEPMTSATMQATQREERSKFRAEIIKLGASGSKRKRPSDENSSENGENSEGSGDEEKGKTLGPAGTATDEQPQKKKKRHQGPKGPNPLAVKKPKKRPGADQQLGKEVKPEGSEPSETPAKRKRRRKHKTAEGDEGQGRLESGVTVGDV
ncbi:rRNA-processing protein UTP23 [Pleurostoma richardsiae]|uniref:U three protein 23 n=1 Tax=Pleurostoma richardsiae TaxID=41990 RepID=A0AA38VIN0_9PEZI|nr:rRNA-processing protein UTP23 [Pleurostoma richardsiae]